MDLIKFLRIILILTALAFLYVHQQTRLIQLAYQEQEKLAHLRSLLDKNRSLRYHINQSTSLVSIARILPIEEFEWPHGSKLVSLSVNQAPIKKNAGISQSRSILSSLFRMNSQAEATGPRKPRILRNSASWAD